MEVSALTPPAFLAQQVLPSIKKTLGMGHTNTTDVEPAGIGAHKLMDQLQEAAEAFLEMSMP